MKINNNSFKYIFILFINILLIELLIKFNINNLTINYSILRIVTMSLIVTILFNIVLLYIKNKNKSTLIFISLFTLYSWFQLNLYNYLGFFMSMHNTEQGMKVANYYKEFIKSTTFKSLLIFIPLIITILYFKYFDDKLKEYIYNKFNTFNIIKENNNKVIVVSIITLLILNVFYIDLLQNQKFQNNLQTINNKTLFLYSDNNNMIVNQFGIIGFTISDVLNPFINDSYMLEEVNKDIKIKKNSRNIDDTIFKEIIDDEEDELLNSINKYIITKNIPNTNEHTGIFKDKNLIVILLESVNDLAINKDLYPNIYKYINEGVYFENNYSPRNSCSTGNNELTVMTSLHTINKSCNANEYKGNIYFHSIFNKFKEHNYTTSSFHNYVEYYYSRRVTHHNLGSDMYENASDLDIKWTGDYEEWPSDVELIEKAYPKFKTNDKFMTFLTTVTTHQPYGYYSKYGDKNLDKLDHLDYSSDIKRYMSKMFELDEALGLLHKNLKKDNLLDDTVIVLFSDHYPYGLSDSELTHALGYDVSEDMLVDKVPFVIYNQSLEGKVVKDYTSLVNVLPTIFNLFDINYDPRLYFGVDLFGKGKKRAIFADASWKDEKGYFNSNTNKFTEYTDNSYTNKEIREINKLIETEKEMSSLIIKNDYFNYLDNEFNKRKDD